MDRWSMDHVEVLPQYFDRQVMPVRTPPVFAPRMGDLYDPASLQQGTNNNTARVREYYARRLEPTSDYVSYASPFNWNGNSGSLSIWVRADSLAAERRPWRGANVTTTGGIFLGVTTAGRLWFFHMTDATSMSVQTANSTIAAGRWYHVAVNYLGDLVASTVEFWLDGVLVAHVLDTNGTGNAQTTNGTWSLGYIGASSVSWLGEIAFPEVYPVILTPSEILALNQERRAFFG